MYSFGVLLWDEYVYQLLLTLQVYGVIFWVHKLYLSYNVRSTFLATLRSYSTRYCIINCSLYQASQYGDTVAADRYVSTIMETSKSCLLTDGIFIRVYEDCISLNSVGNTVLSHSFFSRIRKLYLTSLL